MLQGPDTFQLERPDSLLSNIYRPGPPLGAARGADRYEPLQARCREAQRAQGRELPAPGAGALRLPRRCILARKRFTSRV